MPAIPELSCIVCERNMIVENSETGLHRCPSCPVWYWDKAGHYFTEMQCPKCACAYEVHHDLLECPVCGRTELLDSQSPFWVF